MYMASDGVLALIEELGEVCAEHEHLGRPGIIAIVELTPGQQRNSHGPEVIRADGILCPVGILLARGARTRRQNTIAPLHAAEGSELRPRGCLDARNRFETLLEIAKECDGSRRTIATQTGIDLESDQPVSLESHIVVQQVH